MNEKYIVIDIEWDHQIIEYDDGKKGKLVRGLDYDTSWIKLGEGYAKREKEITFYNEKKFSKLYPIIDFPSFELIESYNTTTNYFKDNNYVYIESYMHRDLVILEDAIPSEFKIIDIKNGYSNSKSIDYCYDKKLPYRLKEVNLLGGNSYQKVGNEIYWSWINKMECDVDTFEIVDNREYHHTVYKDKNYVYHKGEILENINPKTFHFLEDCINEDKRPYYTNCDIHYYAKDDKFAYFVDSINKVKLIKTKDLDGFGFKVVDGKGIAFDKYGEYYCGKKIKK